MKDEPRRVAAPFSFGRFLARPGLCLLASVVSLLGARPASACSVITPDNPASGCCGPAPACSEPGVAHTAAASLSLKVDAVDVRRAVYPPPGKGDCGEIGRVVVRFGLASGEPWPADVSLLIRHSSGHFPWFQPPVATIAAGSGWQMRATEGKVAFVGPDDPREPLDVKLEARAIDCAGEASAPVEISITDPGRPVAVKADADPADPARPLPEASEPAPPLAEPASPRPSSCSVSRAANASLGGVLASSALAMVMRRAQRRRRRR